ncbi:MAG: HlyD family efflux transporter periplasmic adaptor subunit [Bacteroidota bacterium]
MKKYFLLATMAALTACNSKEKNSDAFGNFEATEVIVSSETSGKIVSINVDEGSVVKQGEIAALIDTTDLFLKKEQMKAQKASVASRSAGVFSQIDVQKQQKQNLLVDKARIEKLYKDGAATKKQLDDINGAISVVDKQILSIETQNAPVVSDMASIDKQIAQVDESLRKCRVLNPVNGTVLDKYAEAGEVTTVGKALYKIADLSTLELRVYVSGEQLPSVKIGGKTDVIIDGKNSAPLEGTISWISSTAEFTPKIIQTKEERVNLVYAVKISVKNDGSLKIGMPGEVKFK